MPRPRPVRCVVTGLVLVVAGACGGGGSAAPAGPSATTAADRTQVLTFQAYDDAGLLPTVRRGSTVTGSCTGGSVVNAGRADAWRCTAGDTVLDPCFANPAGGDLACVTDPVAADATMVTLGATLPRTGANRNEPGRLPWFLELADGTRCRAATGGGPPVDGRKLSYACAGGTDVYGDPDGSHPLWTVQARVGAAGALAATAVRVAWY